MQWCLGPTCPGCQMLGLDDVCLLVSPTLQRSSYIDELSYDYHHRYRWKHEILKRLLKISDLYAHCTHCRSIHDLHCSVTSLEHYVARLRAVPEEHYRIIGHPDFAVIPL